MPSPPELDYGGFIEDVVEGPDGVARCTYCHVHDCGLYSNMSTIMSSVIMLARAGYSVSKIDTTRTFSYYKNSANKDVYLDFYNGILGNPMALSMGLDPDEMVVHRVYKDLPLSRYGQLGSALFPPSSKVLLEVSSLIGSHEIDLAQTIAVYYRGTDKSTEVKLASIEAYIELCATILKRHANFRLLVQTDQAQVRDRLLSVFPQNSFYFHELPTTKGTDGIHRMTFAGDSTCDRPDIASRIISPSELGGELPLSREDFALRMMAAVEIISQCAVVIGHTGNAAAWIAYKRGSTRDLFQFDAEGRLVEP